MSPLTESTRLTLAKTFTWNESVWNPSMIQTALWLDAADATTLFTTDSGSTLATNGNAVGRWNDKSGNARHVTQGTAGNRPTYNTSGLNSKPTVDWPNTVNSLSLTNTSTYSPARIIGVADYNGNSPFDQYAGLVSFNYTAGSDLLITSDVGSDWFGAYSVFLNGSSTASSTALPTIASPFIFATNGSISSSRTDTNIGIDRTFTDRGWRGKIAEIILLPSVPSTLDRQKTEGYLAHKWGLTANLPAGHPYKTIGPTP